MVDTVLLPLSRPAFVSGRWYQMIPTLTGAGAALTANSIRMLPFTLTEPMTLAGLATRVTTVSAGGNIQLALYASDPDTGLPAGLPVASTGNLSTASAAAVSASVGPVDLEPGVYWMAVNADNSTVVCIQPHSGMAWGAYQIGSATLGEISIGASSSVMTWTVAQTFGTWPNLTGASLTVVATLTCALHFLQAG